MSKKIYYNRMHHKHITFWVDGVNCIIDMVLSLLYVMCVGSACYAMSQARTVSVDMVVLTSFIVLFETYVLGSRFCLRSFYRVTFTTDGITVKHFLKTDCFIAWSKVKEVGIKYWTGFDEHGRNKVGGQYIYFSDHVLNDYERVRIGSYRQKTLQQSKIAYFCCFNYAGGECIEWYKSYPSPNIAQFFPENFFDFEALCKTCVLAPKYEGVECAYVNNNGLKTYTKYEYEKIAGKLIILGKVNFLLLILALLLIFAPVALIG